MTEGYGATSGWRRLEKTPPTSRKLPRFRRAVAQPREAGTDRPTAVIRPTSHSSSATARSRADAQRSTARSNRRSSSSDSARGASPASSSRFTRAGLQVAFVVAHRVVARVLVRERIPAVALVAVQELKEAPRLPRVRRPRPLREQLAPQPALIALRELGATVRDRPGHGTFPVIGTRSAPIRPTDQRVIGSLTAPQVPITTISRTRRDPARTQCALEGNCARLQPPLKAPAGQPLQRGALRAAGGPTGGCISAYGASQPECRDVTAVR